MYRIIMLCLALILVSGCAHIRPIPCEDLTWGTGNGDRSYARLCPEEK